MDFVSKLAGIDSDKAKSLDDALAMTLLGAKLMIDYVANDFMETGLEGYKSFVESYIEYR